MAADGGLRRVRHRILESNSPHLHSIFSQSANQVKINCEMLNSLKEMREHCRGSRMAAIPAVWHRIVILCRHYFVTDLFELHNFRSRPA